MTEIYTESIGGVELKLRRHTPDRFVARSCLVQGEFDLCKEIVTQPRFNFIIDAGGYIGTAAIWFAMQYPESLVVTVEPSSDNFAVLQRNVSQFKNILPIQSAVVARSRYLDLMDRGTGSWGFSVVEKPRDNAEPEQLHRVSGITLDEIIYDHKMQGVDILKLDIEGGEKEVFQYPGYWSHNTAMVVAELHNRITLGCSEQYAKACAHMRQLESSSKEKVMAVNDAMLSAQKEP